MVSPTAVRIPGYRLLRQLGFGSSGVVFRGVHEGLSREVAVKILLTGLFNAEETRERFVREAKLQARLTHPNLLKIFDAGFAGDKPYLVAELASGGTLRDRLESRGALKPLEAARLGAAIASGLAHAHDAGIVHRDLKPENVLFTDDGQPKVADFGLAKAQDAADQGLTHTGIILGTPGYLAPEVIRGEPAGSASDVYALGVMLHEMLLGERLFGTGSYVDILERQLTLKPDKTRLAMLGAPADVANILAGCLDQAARPRPTAHRVERALAGWTTEPPSLATVVSGPVATPAAPPPPRPLGSLAGRATIVASADLRRPSIKAAPRVAATMASAARMGPTSRRHPGWVWLAGGALSSVLVAVGVLALLRPSTPLARPAPPPTANPPAAGPPSRPVPKPEPPPPPLEVSFSDTRAHLWLARPEPVAHRVRLTLLEAGRPAAAAPSLSEIPAGKSDRLLEGLEPAKDYEVEVSGPGFKQTAAFRTMKHPEFPVATMRPSSVDLRAMAMTARGDHVFLAWSEPTARGGRSAMLSESLDGGLTWMQPQPVGTPAGAIEHVALCPSKDGLAMGWLAGAKQGDTAELVFRRAGSRQWLPPVRTPCVAPGPLLAEAAGGGYHLVVARSQGGMLRGRLEPGSGSAPKFTPMLAEAPGLATWAQLLESKGRLSLFVLVGSTRKPSFLGHSSGDVAGTALWPALRALSEPGASVVHPAAVTGAGKLLAVYPSGTGVRTLVSSDGGRTFAPAGIDFKLPEESGSDWDPGFTTAVWDGSRFLVGSIFWRWGESLGMLFQRSADAVRWETAGTLKVSIAVHVKVAAVATSPGVLTAQLSVRDGLTVDLFRPQP